MNGTKFFFLLRCCLFCSVFLELRHVTFKVNARWQLKSHINFLSTPQSFSVWHCHQMKDKAILRSSYQLSTFYWTEKYRKKRYRVNTREKGKNENKNIDKNVYHRVHEEKRITRRKCIKRIWAVIFSGSIWCDRSWELLVMVFVVTGSLSHLLWLAPVCTFGIILII